MPGDVGGCQDGVGRVRPGVAVAAAAAASAVVAARTWSQECENGQFASAGHSSLVTTGNKPVPEDEVEDGGSLLKVRPFTLVSASRSSSGSVSALERQGFDFAQHKSDFLIRVM